MNHDAEIRPRLSTGLKALVRMGMAGRAAPGRMAVCGIASCNVSAMLRARRGPDGIGPDRNQDRNPDRNQGLNPVPAQGSARRREAGIRVGEHWYCSSPCFEEAVESRLLHLLFQEPARAANLDRMPLNLLLMTRGMLTQQQSLEALAEQRQTGARMEEVLTGLGFVTEEQITLARATQAGYPVYSLRAIPAARIGLGGRSGPPLPASAAISIPRTLVELYSMLPLHYAPATGRLLVGFVERVDHGVLYAIEQMTGARAEPCFLAPADFRERLARPEYRPANEEVLFERGGRPVELARMVRNHAVELQAEEARFGRTRDYLWVRLRSARREVDLLFLHPRSRMAGGAMEAPGMAGFRALPALARG